MKHQKNSNFVIRRIIMLEKVIVIGCPGTGKSTFARKLRDMTGLPLFYLDMIWHKPDQTNITQEEFDEKLNAVLKQERWLIDGNYLRTLKTRLQLCDTVFFLDYPLKTCLESVKSRIGQKREDMPWIEKEFDEEFKQFIVNFPQNSLPQIYELLEKYQKEKDIIVFKSRQDADNYLNNNSLY